MTYNYFDHHDSIQGIPQDSETWGALVNELETLTNGNSVIYVEASDFDVPFAADTVGKCLNCMVDCPNSPYDIMVWSGETSPPRKYKIEPA